MQKRSRLKLKNRSKSRSATGLTEDGAQDSYTGRRTREFVSKYCTEKENETPKMIATKFDVPVEDLLALNNVRFFGDKLMSSSKLRNKTKLLVPTRVEGGPQCFFKL